MCQDLVDWLSRADPLTHLGHFRMKSSDKYSNDSVMVT